VFWRQNQGKERKSDEDKESIFFEYTRNTGYIPRATTYSFRYFI